MLALGSPGGATIITTVLQVLLERVDLGKPVVCPRRSPRRGVSNRNRATTLERRARVPRHAGGGGARALGWKLPTAPGP